MTTRRKAFAAKADAGTLFGVQHGDQAEGSKAPSPVADGQCPSCRQFMPREFFAGRGDTPSVVHCTGSVTAWQKGHIPKVHHGRRSYGVCWKCGGNLGCDQCSGSASEVLCKRCAAWGTPAAFAEHGPILNSDTMIAKRYGIVAPAFEDYPDNFRRCYRRVNANEPQAPSLEDWKARAAEIKVVPEPEPQDYDSDVPLFQVPIRAFATEDEVNQDKRQRIRDKAREMGLL